MGNQKTLKDLGIVSPVPMGDWTIATQYTILNIVRYNGGAYIAKQGNKGVEPNVSAAWQTYWMLLNLDGGGELAVNNISYDNNTQSLTVSYTDGTSESVSLATLISGVQNDILEINEKIPSAASSSNKLVDNAAMQSFALPITTKYGANLSLAFNSANGVLTAQLKDQDGNNLGQAQTVTINLQSIENTINGILDLIPAQASLSNQLADKDFVNSSISTNTAHFIGTFNSLAELKAYSGTITNNDYANVINSVITNNGSDFASKTDLDNYPTTDVTNYDYAWVINGSKFDLYRYDLINEVWNLRVENTDKADVTLNTVYNRYKANVVNSVITWEFEFTINNTTFTAVQWAAINSGITASLVSNYNAHIADKNNPHEVTASQIGLGNVVNTGDSDTPVEDGTTKFTTGGAYLLDVKKADKVSGAMDGNFAGLDANGNLTDSRKSASDFSKVSVSTTGTATDEVQYITIDGVEKKIAGSGGGTNTPFTLIKKIITGYSLLASEPADWSTNYTDYYKNTGTADNPTYVQLTELETFTTNTYYSYTSASASVAPPRINLYANTKEIIIKATTKDTNCSSFWLRPLIGYTPIPAGVSYAYVLKYASAFTTAQAYTLYATFTGSLHIISENICKADELFNVSSSKVEINPYAYSNQFNKVYSNITEISYLSFNAGNVPGNVTIEIYAR